MDVAGSSIPVTIAEDGIIEVRAKRGHYIY